MQEAVQRSSACLRAAKFILTPSAKNTARSVTGFVMARNLDRGPGRRQAMNKSASRKAALLIWQQGRPRGKERGRSGQDPPHIRPLPAPSRSRHPAQLPEGAKRIIWSL